MPFIKRNELRRYDLCGIVFRHYHPAHIVAARFIALSETPHNCPNAQ